eukprot:CAMPEP_0170504458 /NCGR_PEP_ID=MMETSP0208-20121228/47973_1 /TAXON_ID=197538 /ORGANISM="Strombidium inclinatum, Strain S3" /LENGTH=55 /DNA_ID=CAMNT_0010784729 /DNA_START=426 /DNA_END=590 /DNA_ORIENTATION=-
MRGQAFVVFRRPQEAAVARQKLQGFSIFGKKIEVDFAKETSDATYKSQGLFDSTM